ncbi:DUF5336 domain-containing protein [Amycolatopsis cynarae]|uniref:DUF5336 domain-containing protein n=1 Tax=Amycolatopsis cynarae TaxID=2995223 RepID=A0ABY7AYG2_9PSEU|nr:DUF5336 domain-containing protein [Amycolatopsis sp. HUAS 11-8]WAL65057.1 DUF5336 domain-containing protein [Amycolatopsis sp. HUAS 11-8]
MTFPSGGPGYPQQGGGAHSHPQAPGTGGFPQQQAPSATLSVGNLTVLLSLAVTLLGLVNYFIGFSDEASGADWAINFLLAGGLLAALKVLPQGPKILPFAALFSVLGGLNAILAVVRVPARVDTPGVLTVILILGILQMLVAIATLLFDQGVLKLPSPQQQPVYGQPYGQQQPPQAFGQQHQGGDAPGGPQGTQFGPPVTPQSTVYAPQQGQFYQPRPAESGQQPGGPGTPPGGTAQQG